MADTFTWKGEVGGVGKSTAKVVEVQFGDGYSQATADGLNCVAESWNFSYTGNYPEVSPIREFLRTHVGRSFNWTTPFNEERLFRCKEFSVTSMGNNLFRLTADFVEIFSP